MRYLTYILGAIGAVLFWLGVILVFEKLGDFLQYQLKSPESALWRARKATAAWLRKGL